MRCILKPASTERKKREEIGNVGAHMSFTNFDCVTLLKLVWGDMQAIIIHYDINKSYMLYFIIYNIHHFMHSIKFFFPLWVSGVALQETKTLCPKL